MDNNIHQPTFIDHVVATTAVEETIQEFRLRHGIWRWEVKESRRHWLPNKAKENVGNRQEERAKAKNKLTTIFRAQPEEETRMIHHIKTDSEDCVSVSVLDEVKLQLI
ncbi:hypothetical protein C8R42DRAFT_637974 [Lentinula raphanica]|nr:hypothetical protein C8R42DRAFT_637974 [Lentinula raphanica]